MADLDRVVAGVSCREVLIDLSDLMARELPPERMATLGRHVSACHICESFGGRFSVMVERLRTAHATAADPVPPDVALRLADRLAGEYATRRD